MPPATSVPPPMFSAPRRETWFDRFWPPVSFVLILIVSGIFLYIYFGAFGAGAGSKVEFLTTQGPAWFSVHGSSLAPALGAAGASIAVLETAPPLANGAVPVLVRKDGMDEFGLFTNGSFSVSVSNRLTKQGLFVRPDGLAVFGEGTAPLPKTLPKGTPPPVVITDAPPAPTLLWNIEAVFANGAAVNLGEGVPIGVAGDGTVLALSSGSGPGGIMSGGVVSVNPLTKARTPVVNAAMPVPSGALSGNLLAFVNPATTAVDIYRLDPARPASATYLFSTAPGATAVAFSGATLIVRTGATSADAYALSEGTSSLPAPAKLTISTP